MHINRDYSVTHRFVRKLFYQVVRKQISKVSPILSGHLGINIEKHLVRNSLFIESFVIILIKFVYSRAKRGSLKFSALIVDNMDSFDIFCLF